MNQQRPEISAIVIVYNGMKFLPDCLRTLTEDLSNISHELILVDNNSRDGSREFIQENYPDATLIEHEANYGFAAAVNAGLKRGSGENFYILNQDLRFRVGATGKLLGRLKQDSKIGFIGPKFVYFSGGLQRFCRAFPRYRHVFYSLLLLDRFFSDNREFGSWRMSWFDHQTEAEVDQPMGAAMLIPGQVINEIGLMDERFPLLFNDVDYCKRIADAGYKRLYFPEAVIEHFVGASTGSRPYALILISHVMMFRYFRKHALTQFNPILWICGLILILFVPVTMALRYLRRSLTKLVSGYLNKD